ncbi:MAG: FHA domain-containing protein [Gemmataceae bacterium]
MDETPFIPLRLVLQPSGYGVDLTRPEMILGRHSVADIRLPLPDVSRRHCRFLFEGGQWRVFDLGSLNGVFVNGERVESATLHEGDMIGIGGYTFSASMLVNHKDHQDPAETQDSGEAVLRSIADALPGFTSMVLPIQRRAS